MQKNIKKIVLSALIPAGVFLLNSCKQAGPPYSVYDLENTGSEATDPYLTHDNAGNAVLGWTERNPVDSLYRLRYAVYNPQNHKFGKPVTVTPSAGTTAVAESMNKIAFKGDGTIIAMFTKHFENESNPWAGAICYSMSSDKGRTWSLPQYIHSDTSHTYSRSFFDIATLKNGEIAATWLDGRYGKADTGSALFFASTVKGRGFGADKCISKHTCECCRTELLSDDAGNIRIAWRSILYPPALLGKQVRDMVYTFSKDSGKTFAPVTRISKDNWEIEGCPHSGPSLAVTGKQVHAVWFTAGGSPGLYYSYSARKGEAFAPRTLITSSGHHPQITSLSDGRLVMVCEEDKGGPAADETMPPSHGMMNHTVAASESEIVLRILNHGKADKKIVLTKGMFPEHHAVVTTVNNGLLIAWVQEKSGDSRISYSFIKPD